MQEWAFDYYSEGNLGCCLHCFNSYEGCLCYNCKCKKCYWYTSSEEWDGEKGHCDKTYELVEEKIERNKRLENKKFQEGLLLKKQNGELTEKIKSKKEIVNIYVCQNCQREFVSEKEHRIEKNKIPCCDICLGKIKFKEEKNDN